MGDTLRPKKQFPGSKFGHVSQVQIYTSGGTVLTFLEVYDLFIS